MKTTDFIAQLVANSQSQTPVRVRQMFIRAVLLASLVSMMLLLGFWGIDEHIVLLIDTPRFWIKTGLMLWLCASAWAMVLHLSRPDASTGRTIWHAGACITALLSITMLSLPVAPPEELDMLTQASPWELAGVDHGWAAAAQEWQAVWRATASISALAIPWLAGLLCALRSMAPTQPAWAGASAGFMAGAVSALLYSLHTSISAGPFETLGCLLGMSLMPTIGALLGRRLLRW